MGALRHFIGRNRATFAWMMALTIAVRALMPIGWMPSATAGQMISICTGDGISTAVIGADGKIHKPDPATADHKSSPCTFAGLALTSNIPEPAAQPSLPYVAKANPPALPDAARPGAGLAAPPPPKTGPPALT